MEELECFHVICVLALVQRENIKVYTIIIRNDFDRLARDFN